VRDERTRHKAAEKSGDPDAHGTVLARWSSFGTRHWLTPGLVAWFETNNPFCNVQWPPSRHHFIFKESILPTDTKHGVVKWFNHDEGFRFLSPDGGGRDSFVHISAVQRSGLKQINEGDRVTYSLDVDQKSGKRCAVDIRLVSWCFGETRKPSRPKANLSPRSTKDSSVQSKKHACSGLPPQRINNALNSYSGEVTEAVYAAQERRQAPWDAIDGATFRHVYQSRIASIWIRWLQTPRLSVRLMILSAIDRKNVDEPERDDKPLLKPYTLYLLRLADESDKQRLPRERAAWRGDQ
jgi:CspA family cold shock protein